jgi:uncharacterized membrane protein YqaE (UPF0057 family)
MYGSYSRSYDEREGGSLTMEILRVLLAVLFPPLGVFLRVGFTIHLLVNVLLTLLGYIPGLVHAVWLLAQTSEHKLKV